MFYHLWFATKRRKWLLQGEVGEEVKRLMSEIAQDKDSALLECETA